MSNSISAKRATTLSFAFIVSSALVAEFVVLGQDQDEQSRGAMIVTRNSNTQQSETTSTSSSRRRRNRRNRRSRSSGRSTAADASAATEGTTSVLMDSGERSPGEQTDLSGTYAGEVNFPEGGIEGQGTLTITGNQFTLTSGTETRSGRLTAITTRGYTGVAMQFEGPSPSSTTGTPYIVSARAIRRGDNLTLTNVEGSDRIFTFGTGGGRTTRGRRGRRGRANTNSNTSGEATGNTNDSTDASDSTNSNMSTEENTNTRSTRGRGGRRRRGSRNRATDNMNSNMNSNTDTP